jgi:hypothetical protein
MGHRVTVDDLALMIRTALDAAGKTKVPVVAPGTHETVIPAVAIQPGDDEVLDGNRVREGYEIVILVPRNQQPEQYEHLCELRNIVLVSLYPSPVRIDGPILFDTRGGDGSGDAPAQAKTIPVSFTVDVDIC